MRAVHPLPTFAERVIEWQRCHGRHGLPWQGTRDPYRVWLSEIMLQQTQVATVLRYYPRFLERFTDVQSLAQAALDEVLALWSGLGYYSRARNLHRCARQVVAEHGGQFPGHAAALATLPGIGRSTAAAIAAFCFGERVAILDGNVKRVLARALAFDGDLAAPSGVAALWQRAEELLPARGIETYTQGLMDLGAGVCLRSKPLCGNCPLQAMCEARRQGCPQSFPVKSRSRVRGRREEAILWLEHRGAVWLCRRPATGVWASLWSLPSWGDARALAQQVEAWPGEGRALSPIDHALTHFDWRLHPLRWELPSRLGPSRLADITSCLPAGQWVAREALGQHGLPAPIRRLIEA